MAINLDFAHEFTDKQIELLERRLKKHYQQAGKEAQKKYDEYFQQFKVKDEEMRKLVEAGEMDKDAYRKWRQNQILTGMRWSALSQELAKDYYEVDKSARQIVRDAAPKVYAENVNYDMYTIEKQLGYDTSFTLYSEESVRQLLVDDPRLIYDKTNEVSAILSQSKNQDYYQRKIQSATVLTILLGLGISYFALNVAKAIGASAYKSAVAYARTAMTEAQNKGRSAAEEIARSMGIECRRQWVATLDMRTRHSHAILNGEYEDEDGFFENGLRFPGDTEHGYPEDWMNCRCTTITTVERVDYDMSFRSEKDLGGMSYDEWKQFHKKRGGKE